MGKQVIGSIAIAAMILSSIAPSTLAQDISAQPRFKTLALCLAAYERERGLAMDANARITKAKFNSPEESAAMLDQGKHNKRASSIKEVCDNMERDERPMSQQVKELTGLLDSLGPTGGSTRAPVTGAIRKHNLTKAGDKLEQVGGTLDQALANLRAVEFGNGRGPQAARLTGRPDPALGAAAAANLRADVADWNRQEAERQRLAAIAAEELRIEHAEQQRIQMAEARARRQAEAEEKASSSSGFWNTLAIGVLGVAAITATRNGDRSTTRDDGRGGKASSLLDDDCPWYKDSKTSAC